MLQQAKNWQLGWFSGAYKEVAFGSSYDGPIKGQINYDVSGVAQTPVVVKVGDYFVGFNHQAKHNANTNEGGNQVTIQKAQGSGYVQSWLVAKLNTGGTFSTDVDGFLLRVTVNSINTNADTGVTQVSIVYGDCLNDAACRDENTCNGAETCNLGTGICDAGQVSRFLSDHIM